MRLGIRIFTMLKLERMIGYKSDTPVPRFSNFDFDKWMEVVRRDLNVSNLYAIVSFPSQPERKRFYVNLVSKEGEPIAFAKISLDEENSRCLSNESNNIFKLRKKTYSFKIPRILIEDIFEGYKFLVFESLPLNCSNENNDWETTLKGYSKELCTDTKDTKSINELSWWERFIREVPEKDRALFLKDFDLHGNISIDVCLAHGDLHNGNICCVKDKIWLFDWESSCMDAPVMTDEIVNFLGMNQRKVVSNPKEISKELGKKFVRGKNQTTKLNVAMALAFLCTTDRQDAKSMLYYWEYIID